jgi:bacterioferritin-associated ferredoxin
LLWEPGGIGIHQKNRFFFAYGNPARYINSVAIIRKLVVPMIVCSCNVLSDHDVRSAVGAPGAPRTAGQVYGCLGCSPQCGRCVRTIQRIMDEALAAGRNGGSLNGDHRG